MRAIRKFLEISRSDKSLVLKALVAVLRACVIVHVFPSSYVTRCLEHQTWSVRFPSRYSVDRIVWSIAAVGKYVPGATCLVQAIALSQLMIANGHECRIEIGVAKSSEGRFAAHAWVRYKDVIVLGGDTEQYRPIGSFPHNR